jgi:hypothetical protein
MVCGVWFVKTVSETCRKKRLTVVFPTLVEEFIPNVDTFTLGNATFTCVREPSLEITVECPPETSPWTLISRLSKRIPAFQNVVFHIVQE